MNYININNYTNLLELLDINILITGDLNKQREELEYNTWEMTFDRDFIKTITLQNLQDFISKLINNRADQVAKANKSPATFYLWYDEQSLNLCFDILSGNNIKLPFGCTLNVFKTPYPILEKFLKDAQSDTNYLSWENLTILNPGDPGFGEDDDDDEIDWIQDVYVTTLP